MHGWKIETTAKGMIIKTSCYEVVIYFCLQSREGGFLLLEYFLDYLFEGKLKAINKHQLFESCLENKGTIECQLSGLNDSVTYDDELLKPNLIVQAQ